MITTNHFLKNKARKIARKLRVSDHRLNDVRDYINATRLNRALHEIEMLEKINDGIYAVLGEVLERAKERRNFANCEIS